MAVSFFAGLAFLALTNGVVAASTEVWSILHHERIGAESFWYGSNTITLPNGLGQMTPGPSDQWRFYTFTNAAPCTHLAVLTFQPLSLTDPLSTNRAEPDLDLYVSTSESLTNLEPAAIQQAWYSVDRGGHETVVIEDAAPDTVYYIAVNCQSQGAAEFSLLMISSEQPFSDTDEVGNRILRGLAMPDLIQDAASGAPVSSSFLAVAPEPLPIHRVVVSNLITHARPADLQLSLAHNGQQVVLKAAGTEYASEMVFDDTLEKDLLHAQTSDGPGSLRDFVGYEGRGQWLFTYTDFAADYSGTNEALSVFLERQRDLRNGLSSTVLPGATVEHVIEVPLEATNLSVSVFVSSGSGRLNVSLCREQEAASDCLSGDVTDAMAGLELIKNKYSNPPLNAGQYFLRLHNESLEPLMVDLSAALFSRIAPPAPETFGAYSPVAIADETLTTAEIRVDRPERVTGLDVGVRIDHPRISDLALTLVSPGGTRVLLAENRGGTSTNGMGFDTSVINTVPVSSSGGALAATNVMQVGPGLGTVEIVAEFYGKPDELRIYRGEDLVLNSGLVSHSNFWQMTYAPDPLGTLTVVMNEGNNNDPETLWDYIVTTTRYQAVHATFTENTAVAQHSIKFAPPPFTNCTTVVIDSNLVCYLPEESLGQFVGESAAGTWKLEIWDRRPDALSPPPLLRSWELLLHLEDTTPLPLLLSHGVAHTNTIPPRRFLAFKIDFPAWAARATNILLYSSVPVQLWYNATGVPTSTNPGDIALLGDALQGEVVLTSETTPQLIPGETYYLALVNTNAAPAEIAFRTDFDVGWLSFETPLLTELAPGPLPRYFAFEVADQSSLSLGMTNLTGNLNMVLRKGTPLPTLEKYDYGSFEDGTNAEQILLIPESLPVALSPGTWHVGLYNADQETAAGTLLLQDSLPPPVISSIAVDRFVRLFWRGPPGASYQVEWTPAFEPAQWTTFTQVVTSDTGWFTFVDDDSLTGELQVARLYRILRLP